MIVFNYYYYFTLFLIVHMDFISALQCYECNGIVFNYSITMDKIPSPSDIGCKIGTARSSCSVRVGWFEDSGSEVFYTTDLGLPLDSISVQIDRRVTTWSAEYATRRYIIYTCQPSNSTPCNTVENFKRAMASTTFPTNEQIQKFDTLIAPTTEFFGSSCFQTSNMTTCPETNLVSCQQCWGIMEYSKQINTCAMCPAGKALTNFIEYSSTFFLTNQTRSDSIRLGCRKFGPCNSVENLLKIKNTLNNQFDFDQFNNSTVLSTSSMIVLFIIFLLNKQLIFV
jgi:hypothetical protein